MPAKVWAAGLCIRHLSRLGGQRGSIVEPRQLWTSSLPSDREKAAAVCTWCPVLTACREWAAHLPASDNAIYGAMDARARLQARRTAA